MLLTNPSLVGQSGVSVGQKSLLEQATAYFNGVEPTHYWDFTTNRAIFSGVTYSSVTDTPGWSGSPTISSRGMLIDGLSTPLVTPADVSFPLSLFVEIERVTDTGLNEMLIVVDDNTIAERTSLRIHNTTDLATALMFDNSVSQADVSVAGATVAGGFYKIAGAFNTNRVQAAKDGVLGTEDTSCTLPVNPTHIRWGMRSDGGQVFSGYILRAAIFNSALSDANLQTITS